MASSFVNVFTGNPVIPADATYELISLTGNLTLVWPISFLENETHTCGLMNVNASSAGYTITLPDATQVAPGTVLIFINVGSNSFNVYNNAGGSITTIASGIAKYLYLETNSTAAGTWGVIQFGAGTSSADASLLAGDGLIAIDGLLNTELQGVEISTNYVSTEADRAQTFVWTGGTSTFTLPDLVDIVNGFFLAINNYSLNSGILTVQTVDNSLINFSTEPLQLLPGQSAFFVYTGSNNWATIGYSVSSSSTTPLVTAININLTDSGGSYTLTAEEAKNQIITFSGTLAENTIVFFPQKPFVYNLFNNTGISAFTLTIQCIGGTAQTAFAIDTATYICNGTDMIPANLSYPYAVDGSGDYLSSYALFVSGTASKPSINFGVQTTGIYSNSEYEIDISSDGANVLAVNNISVASQKPIELGAIDILSYVLAIS